MILLLALLLGIAAGLRAAMPLAAIAWGGYLGWIALSGTWLAFTGYLIVPIIFTVLAILELVGDQLPSTPSRLVPPQFGGRIVTGGFSGMALGLPTGSWLLGLVAGVVGAVIGTLGGYHARKSLVAATGGRDLPVALVEDLVAIVLAFWVVSIAG